MTPPFVPLAAPGLSNSENGAAANQLRLVSLPAVAPAVHPAPGAVHPAAVASPPAADARCATPPTLMLQREGDRIVGIRIQCSCGQSIELACTYP